jgi:hypothetical protein
VHRHKGWPRHSAVAQRNGEAADQCLPLALRCTQAILNQCVHHHDCSLPYMWITHLQCAIVTDPYSTAVAAAHSAPKQPAHAQSSSAAPASGTRLSRTSAAADGAAARGCPLPPTNEMPRHELHGNAVRSVHGRHHIKSHSHYPAIACSNTDNLAPAFSPGWAPCGQGCWSAVGKCRVSV